MIILVAVASSFLFGVGFYLIMKEGLLNRAFGLLLISHGANFVILTMAGQLDTLTSPPLLQHNLTDAYADPLPQALILTALVIGFSVAAFLWALVLRIGKEDKA